MQTHQCLYKEIPPHIDGHHTFTGSKRVKPNTPVNPKDAVISNQHLLIHSKGEAYEKFYNNLQPTDFKASQSTRATIFFKY